MIVICVSLARLIKYGLEVNIVTLCTYLRVNGFWLSKDSFLYGTPNVADVLLKIIKEITCNKNFRGHVIFMNNLGMDSLFWISLYQFTGINFVDVIIIIIIIIVVVVITIIFNYYCYC